MAKAKKITGIDCHAPAVHAIVPVLLTRLQEMTAGRDRALNWSDPEGIHDMRVSSRRLRGALRDFAPYVSKHGLTNATKRIKDLADALGEVRDEDVAIRALQKLEHSATKEATAALEHVVKSREVVRRKARRNLQTALNRTALKSMHRDFTEVIESAVKKSRRKTKLSYIDMARAVVTERLSEVEKLSEGFYRPLRVKPLHKMRIGAKHLRYALELFENCFGQEILVYAKRVAALQTSLGELHDCDVWLKTFGKQLEVAKKEASKDQVAGALWLLSHFVRLRSRHMRAALSQWEEWERMEIGNQLREFLKAKAVETTPEPATSVPSVEASTPELPPASETPTVETTAGQATVQSGS